MAEREDLIHEVYNNLFQKLLDAEFEFEEKIEEMQRKIDMTQDPSAAPPQNRAPLSHILHVTSISSIRNRGVDVQTVECIIVS